jgi:hypothetical protein
MPILYYGNVFTQRGSVCACVQVVKKVAWCACLLYTSAMREEQEYYAVEVHVSQL